MIRLMDLVSMQIYVSRNGQQFGPFTEEEARKHLKEGFLHLQDWAWEEGSSDWRALSDVLPGAHSAQAATTCRDRAPGVFQSRRVKVVVMGSVGILFLILIALGYKAKVHTSFGKAGTERQLPARACGRVRLTTAPTGAVVVLGNSTPRSTPADFRDLPAGRLPLRIILEGYNPIETGVIVKENETTDLKTLTLTRSKGSMQITSIPNGVQFEILNPDSGKKSGRTPVILENLVTGRYEITMKQTGYVDYKQTVGVERDRMSHIFHNLEKRPVMSKEEKAAVRTRGERLFKGGDLDGAAAEYVKILKSDPNHIAALSDLGVTQYYQGKLKDAEGTLRAAVDIRPRDAYCLGVLGMVYCKQGKYDDAIGVLKRSIAIQPANYEAHNFLGVTYLEKGNLEAAQKELLQTVEMDPENGEAHYNLATLFALQTPPSLALARKHYKQAIDLGIDQDPELERKINRALKKRED